MENVILSEKMKEFKNAINRTVLEIISFLREHREKIKTENIEKNRINSLNLKSDIFDRFTKLFIELKKYLKNNNGYDEKKINSIAKDVEEKWGLWLKKSSLGEFVDYKKGREIEESYETFETEIKTNYFQLSQSSIKLLNPFNYIGYKDYSSAYKQDSDSCFFAQGHLKKKKRKTTPN